MMCSSILGTWYVRITSLLRPSRYKGRVPPVESSQPSFTSCLSAFAAVTRETLNSFARLLDRLVLPVEIVWVAQRRTTFRSSFGFIYNHAWKGAGMDCKGSLMDCKECVA